MSNIFRIFRKEMLETLRDRRTVMFMIIMPLLAFPLMINIVARIQSSVSSSEATRSLTVGIVDQGLDHGLEQMLAMVPDTLGGYEVVHYNDWNGSESAADSLVAEVRAGELDAAVLFPSDWEQVRQGKADSPVRLIYKYSEQITGERMKALLNTYGEQLLAERLDTMGLARSEVSPFSVDKMNAANVRETLGQMAGGILPYFFLAFAFLGCMYPAIDLFSGEKERGTMETILVTPVRRSDILTGKLLVVMLSGLISATLALLGLLGGLLAFGSDLGPIMDHIQSILTPSFFLTLYVLFIPISAFFAGVMVSLSVFARNYKEAQSIITPLNIIMVVPAVAGFLPGVKLTMTTALIPIVNVVLATKDLISGNVDWTLVGITFASLLLMAGIAVFFAYRRFGDERNILRT